MVKKNKSKLQKVRERAGLTRGEAAKKIGWAETTYTHYELGHRKLNNATLKTLMKIAKAVGAKSLNDIMD